MCFVQHSKNFNPGMGIYDMGYWVNDTFLKQIWQRYSKAVMAVFVLLVLSVSVTGYSSYVSSSRRNINELSMELSECKSGLVDCSSDRDVLQSEYGKCKDEISTLSDSLEECEDIEQDFDVCKGERTELRVDLVDAMGKLDKRNDELNECISNATVVSDNYEELAENAANAICCIRNQLDTDVDLKYYYIEDNRIKCTADSNATLGTSEFVCS